MSLTKSLDLDFNLPHIWYDNHGSIDGACYGHAHESLIIRVHLSERDGGVMRVTGNHHGSITLGGFT